MAEKNNANIGFEKQIWDAACVLWGHIPAAEYRNVIIGLIFLKYISTAFDKKYKALVAEGDGFENDPDAYLADNVFFVPADARWEKIASAAHKPEIGTVIELEVFEVKLNGRQLDESVLRQIDKEIPYHILFLLEYDGKYQAWTAYKEAAAYGSNAFKVGAYYHTDWLPEDELPLKAEGLSVDKIYENFVRQIAGDALCSEKGRSESLKESVEWDNRRQELEKQIAALQAKVRKEKQLNKQVQLNAELKKLKKELEVL